MLLGGRYELDEPLGTGGFSEVWRATDTVLARPVAVKLLRAGYLQQAEALARFRAEARHAGSLSHENIARVFDYSEPADGAEGQQPYLVMELVDGPSLASLLAASASLDAARTMDVVAQAASGLQAAHEAGLVHRDIKPANILLTPCGTVKITDFGIARAGDSPPVTLTGTLIGTPGYLAPERVAGAQATPASDLYALGVVAYECLAGAPPFSGVPLEVALAHRERPLPPLPMSVPPDVAAFVMQLTAKDAVWRPGSAAEVARRAAELRDGLSRGPAAARHRYPAIPSQAVPPAESLVTSADNRRLGPVPPKRRPRARRHHPSARAVSSITLAGLAGFLLAGVIRFAPPLHEQSAPSFASGHSQDPAPASRSAGLHRAGQSRNTTTSTTGQSAADPAAMSAPAASRPAASQAGVTPGKPGRKPGHGHGRRGKKPGHQNRPGREKDPGDSSGPGTSNGPAPSSGPGNPAGPGASNAQVLTS
jgi:eukaryotic-like serine/threonine-protein kinase